MGRVFIFLGILGIIGGVLIGVVGPFMGGFGFGNFANVIDTAANNRESAAALCREGETLEVDRGGSSYTQGQGFAASVAYYCVNSDGVRRDVTGDFVQDMVGGVFGALPGLLGGIGLAALFSTCGTGLLVIGIVMMIFRARRGIPAAAMQGYGTASPGFGAGTITNRSSQGYPAGTDLNALVSDALAGKQVPGVTVMKTSTLSGDGDLSTRLEGLKTAFDKKLISQEEYERLRKAILDEMG